MSAQTSLELTPHIKTCHELALEEVVEQLERELAAAWRLADRRKNAYDGLRAEVDQLHLDARLATMTPERRLGQEDVHILGTWLARRGLHEAFLVAKQQLHEVLEHVPGALGVNGNLSSSGPTSPTFFARCVIQYVHNDPESTHLLEALIPPGWRRVKPLDIADVLSWELHRDSGLWLPVGPDTMAVATELTITPQDRDEALARAHRWSRGCRFGQGGGR